MDNEVMELIDQLYTMVSEAWDVPQETLPISKTVSRSEPCT